MSQKRLYIGFPKVNCPLCNAEVDKMHYRDYCYSCVTEFQKWQLDKELDAFEKYKAENKKDES